MEELVHGHQFDGGNSEGTQVLDDDWMRQTGVGAPELLGYSGMCLRHALDMSLVDDRLVVRSAWATIRTPVEVGVDDHRGHGVAERVARDECLGIQWIGLVGEQGRIRVGGIAELAVKGLAIRVEQQLVRVAAVPGLRFPGPVYPESVTLAGGDGWQIAVPHVPVDLIEWHSGFCAVLGDQAQFDGCGDLGEQREVGAGSVIGGAQRIRVTRPYLKWWQGHSDRPYRSTPGSRASLARRGRSPPTGREGDLAPQLLGHSAHVGCRDVVRIVIHQHVSLNYTALVGAAHGLGHIEDLE